MTKARDLASNAEGTKPKVIDAAGDLIYGTGSDAASRLAIGTAGQVLQVNSGATAPEWVTSSSGGMTVIASGTLSGATVSLTSIPTTYKNLQLIVRNYLPANDGSLFAIRFNGDSTANRHSDPQELTASDQAFSATAIYLANAQDNAVSQSLIIIDFPDYANTTTWKMAASQTITNDNNTSTWYNNYMRWGFYNQTSAITSLTLLNFSGGNFTSGDYILYGVK